MNARLMSLFLLACLPMTASAQQSGTYRGEPWNGMQIKYSISGATVTSSSEGGPFCCWINTLKGTLAPSGQLSVSGSVGMGAGYHARAVVTVSVGGQSKTWTETVKSGHPGMNWAPFNVSVPIPPGATGGSILVDMTGSYNAGSRGLSVSGSFTLGDGKAPAIEALKPEPPVIQLPPPPPAPPVKQEPSLNEAAADAMDEIIRQFDDACFGRVVRLGDPAKYRKELLEKIRIAPGSSVTKKRDSLGSHEVVPGAGRNVIHLPFDPLKGMTPANKWTIFHEVTHQIEWTQGDQENPLRKDLDMAGFKDRNTHYLDKAVEELKRWKQKEKRVLEGKDTAADARFQWNNFERAMRQLEAGMAASELKGAEGQWWRPDLAKLEKWAGIRMRFDDIRQLYLSGACGQDGKNAKGAQELRKLAQGLSSGPTSPDVFDASQEFREYLQEQQKMGR